MEINNENEFFVFMEIQIWNNKDSNGMFYYNNNLINKFKKVYFTFNKNKKDCFLIKTKDNYIELIDEHKDFNENEGKEILFRIRNSFKNNYYEVINPIIQHKIFTSDYNNYLNDKIWFSVKSHSYLEGNKLNYNLNENDIIKFGRKKYSIDKIHIASKNNIDEDFYKNNNISYVSIINKKSKPIFNIDIKPNKYKISNKKNINIEKANEEKANKVNEVKANKLNEINKVNEVNIKDSKNINKNNNETYIDSKNDNINFKNSINNTNNNILNNNSSGQNNDKNGKNYYQNNSILLPTNDHSINVQNGNENNNNYDSENENDIICTHCLEPNYNEDNPLVCLCNCKIFYHYECLKKIMKSKVINQNYKKTVTTYKCIIFYCHICLKPYQVRFRIPEIDRTYELIDLNLPEKTDYICLESLDYIKDNNNNNIKILHIAQLIDNEINIGRANYNDIIDEDKTVSREHAILKYNKYNQNLFLENKNGKFGTLILIRGNIKIREEKTYFQILNTHISMKLANKKNFD